MIESVEQQHPSAIALLPPLSFASDDPAADRRLADHAEYLVTRLEEQQGVDRSDRPYFKTHSLPRPTQIPAPRELLSSLRNPLRPYLPQAEAPLFLPPLPLLQDRVQAGALMLPADRDGILRRIPLLIPWQERLLPSLPLQLLLSAQGETLQDIDYQLPEFPGPLRLGKQRINLDAGYQLLLDRFGPAPRLADDSGQ